MFRAVISHVLPATKTVPTLLYDQEQTKVFGLPRSIQYSCFKCFRQSIEEFRIKIIWQPLIFTIIDEKMPLVCRYWGHYSKSNVSAVHMYICAVPVPSDKTRMRPETCIICNQYHSLMVSALPMAAHNGPFLRFSASCSAFLMVTEWGQWVSPGKKQEERWDLSFTCQKAGIASTWHVVHACAGSRSGRHNKRQKNTLQTKIRFIWALKKWDKRKMSTI